MKTLSPEYSRVEQIAKIIEAGRATPEDYGYTLVASRIKRDHTQHWYTKDGSAICLVHLARYGGKTRHQWIAAKFLYGKTKSKTGARPGYDAWMKEVDRILATQLVGVTSSDLPDMDFTSWYEDGLNPRAAARRAMKEAETY